MFIQIRFSLGKYTEKKYFSENLKVQKQKNINKINSP